MQTIALPPNYEIIQCGNGGTAMKRGNHSTQRKAGGGGGDSVESAAESALADADAITSKPFSERTGDEQGLGGPAERLREGLSYLKNPDKFLKAPASEQVGVIDMLVSTHGSNNAIPRPGKDAASVALRVTAARAEIAGKLYSKLSSKQKEEFVAKGGGQAFAGLEGRNPAYAKMRSDIKKRYEAQQYKADMARKAKRSAAKPLKMSNDPFDLL